MNYSDRASVQTGVGLWNKMMKGTGLAIQITFALEPDQKSFTQCACSMVAGAQGVRLVEGAAIDWIDDPACPTASPRRS
jgi:hypothetical protein